MPYRTHQNYKWYWKKHIKPALSQNFDEIKKLLADTAYLSKVTIK